MQYWFSAAEVKVWTRPMQTSALLIRQDTDLLAAGLPDRIYSQTKTSAQLDLRRFSDLMI